MHHGSLYKKELYLVKGVVVFLKIMKLWKPLPGVGQVLESHTFKAYLAKPKMEEKGTKEDEMAGWHHRLDGREFEWTSGDGVPKKRALRINFLSLHAGYISTFPSCFIHTLDKSSIQDWKHYSFRKYFHILLVKYVFLCMIRNLFVHGISLFYNLGTFRLFVVLISQ